MTRSLVTLSDPHAAVLRTPCAPVNLSSLAWPGIVADLYDTLAATDNGVGLSAPQVNWPVRIFVVNFRGTREAFINPDVIRTSENEGSDEEGCLSLPGVSVRVKRPKIVWLNYTDAAGVRRTNRKYKGMDARICLHELDHLSGVLITDYDPTTGVRITPTDYTSANT